MLAQIESFTFVWQVSVPCPVLEFDSKTDVFNPHIKVDTLARIRSELQPYLAVGQLRMHGPSESMLEIRLGMEEGSLPGKFVHDVVDTEYTREAHARRIAVGSADMRKLSS